MTISSDQFKEIMRLFDAGDFESRKRAVSMLYEGYSRHYLIVIKRDFMHNNFDDDTAEEVLQDTFLSLLSKQTRPSSEFAIGAWLKGYVFNVARDNMKKAYRHKEFTYHSDTKPDEEAISSVVDSDNTKDSIMIEECIKQVMIETGKDDPEGVELFSKVKMEGMAYSELTNFYGKTVSNLKKIVSEMNTMLKDLIQPCLERAK
jgi:DNA-directed RNA polymerase specialized sigma24 family protein